MNAEANNNNYQMSNSEFTTPSIISIRLDTDKVILQLETYLKGTEIVSDLDDEGNKVYKELTMAPPKANKKGIYDIMAFIKSKVNAQVVQGYFAADGRGNSEMYKQYMDDVHESLMHMILLNAQHWDIKDDDIGSIIDTILHLIRPFMTRLIGDKERGSYAQTLRTTESNTVQEKGGFSLFRNHKRS